MRFHYNWKSVGGPSWRDIPEELFEEATRVRQQKFLSHTIFIGIRIMRWKERVLYAPGGSGAKAAAREFEEACSGVL